ncbi:MAG: polymer-forming cytoskeletal protein [Chloroflexota bacterium]
MNRKQAKLSILLVSIFAVLFVSQSAEAFDARQVESLVIEESEVFTKDLYFNGNSLIVDGVIQGDLYFAGGSLVINGTIEGDVVAGGNRIEINGDIQDDLMAGGSAVFINEGATVAGDALVGGFGVELAKGATIGGDYLAGAQNVIIAGDIAGDLLGGGAGAEISGTIGGNVDIEYGAENGLPFDIGLLNPNLPADTPRAAEGINLLEGASITGDFHYNSTRTFVFPEEKIGGEISFTQNAIFTPATTSERFSRGIWQGLQRWVIIVALGALVLRFTPALIERPTKSFTSNVGQGVLFGTLAYLFWIPAVVLAVVLLVGLGMLFGSISFNLLGAIVITVGLLLIIFDVVLVLLTLFFLAYVWVGRMVGQRILPSSNNALLPMAVGTLIVVMLARMPFIGWIVRLSVSVVGLGMLWMWWRGRRPAVVKEVKLAPA